MSVVLVGVWTDLQNAVMRCSLSDLAMHLATSSAVTVRSSHSESRAAAPIGVATTATAWRTCVLGEVTVVLAISHIHAGDDDHRHQPDEHDGGQHACDRGSDNDCTDHVRAPGDGRWWPPAAHDARVRGRA